MWVKTCKACVWRSNHAPFESSYQGVKAKKSYPQDFYALSLSSGFVIPVHDRPVIPVSHHFDHTCGQSTHHARKSTFCPTCYVRFYHIGVSIPTLVCVKWKMVLSLSLSPFPTSHFPSNMPTHIHDHVLPFQTPLPSPHSHTQSVIVTTGGNHFVAFWPPPHPHLGADSSCLPRCANSWVRGRISPLTSSRWCRQNRQ